MPAELSDAPRFVRKSGTRAASFSAPRCNNGQAADSAPAVTPPLKYEAILRGIMSTLEEYQALLGKARAALPENLGNRERWSLPPAEVIKEGRFTILRNFRDLVNAVRRDENHLGKYLLQTLATAGQMDGDRLIFTGRVGMNQITSRLDDYVATFVQCSECGSPDTKLTRQDRVQMLQCEACGAHQPVKARKGQRRAEAGAQVREGGTIEVTVEKVGPRGEGMVEMEGYTIIVPKTPVGTTTKVRITRLQGKLAFAEVLAS